jgi:hypothetical protein
MSHSKMKAQGSIGRSDEQKENFNAWFIKLYDINNLTHDDLKSMYDSFSYKGFNRHESLKQLSQLFPDQKLAIEAILAVALRGPQAGSRLKLSNNKTLTELGVPASGGKGSQTLTCNKIQAATADLAAFMLKRLDVPKRLDMPCPGWLQFPSAGSIKLPEGLRSQHKDFAQRFSTVIGGSFNEQIYMQMTHNAYYDDKLGLF